ncbi:Apyrase, partial [Cinara cedri]
SFQLINLVVLVATINGVYSDVTIDFNNPLPAVEKGITYPITKTVYEFRIAVVSDLETDSKVPGGNNAWYTYYKKGYLTYDPNSEEVSVRWDSGEERGDQYYTNDANEKGRGFELSEITTFDGHLIAADDQTGILYVYEKGIFKSWLAVPISKENSDADSPDHHPGEVIKEINANGDQPKRTVVMPIEWATVKDDHLYVGPNGRDGLNFVAKINKDRQIEFIDWEKNFKALKSVVGVESGYMVHESCVYSDVHKKFYLLPKRASEKAFNEETDNENNSNWLLSLTDENGDKPTVKKEAVIVQHPDYSDRAYTSFRFIPNSNDNLIVALQSSDKLNATYITVFTIDGKSILNSTKVSDIQYEGLEFI